MEADYIARKALLNRRLDDLLAEKKALVDEKSKKDVTINTLTRDFREREQKYEHEKAKLESRIQELERTQREVQGSVLFMFKEVHGMNIFSILRIF